MPEAIDRRRPVKHPDLSAVSAQTRTLVGFCSDETLAMGTTATSSGAEIGGSSPDLATRNQENPPLQLHGRGRITGSVLPYWYPRTPLRDITAIVRAIERRRDGVREIELEHGFKTPVAPSVRKKTSPSSVLKVQKLILEFTQQKDGDDDEVTPQKRLLNSIETMEKVVKIQLWKMETTPSAKKSEREKKVRTLLTMR